MYRKKRLLEETEKTKIINKIKMELSRRKEVVFAYLHGSFLLPVPCGDMDIAVYLEDDVFSRKHWEYEAGLVMSLEPLAGMPVDVQTLNGAPVALRYHVIRGEVLYSGNEPARFAFLEATWREFFDCQPMFRTYYQDLLQQLPGKKEAQPKDPQGE